MKKNINEIKRILKSYFWEHSEMEVVYIFGSLASGKANALSDIDIGILLDKGQIDEKLYRYGYKAEILTDLIKLLKTNNVDLVILNEANYLLRHRILYSGKVIYSRSEKRRIQFQVNTIDKYADFKQLKQEYR